MGVLERRVLIYLYVYICIHILYLIIFCGFLELSTPRREVSSGLTLYFANAIKSQAMHTAFGNLPSIQFLDQSTMMLGAGGHNSCMEVEACRHVILKYLEARRFLGLTLI